MARPRKKADQLHCVPLKLWVTEAQKDALKELAEFRDIPPGVLGREAFLAGLRAYMQSLNQARAA